MLNPTSTQAGLQLTLDNIMANTRVISVQINDRSYISEPDRINELRPVEQAYYTTSSDGVRTTVIYDNLSVSQAEARFSMYTTLFVTFLLVVSTNSTGLTDRGTDRGTDRQRNRQTKEQTEEQIEEQIVRERNRQRNRQTEKQTEEQTDRQTDKGTDRGTDRQRNRQRNRQRKRQRNRQRNR